jgi:hypothetical protein
MKNFKYVYERGIFAIIRSRNFLSVSYPKPKNLKYIVCNNNNNNNNQHPQ